MSEPILALSTTPLQAFDALERMPSWDWLCMYGASHKGDPFDGASYPYLRGICEAWDNPNVRRVFFRACSRVGKTEINLGLHVYSQHHDPDVGLIATPTERLLRKSIKDRLWPMLDLNSQTRHGLPKRYFRAATKCRTDSFITHGAWSGSVTTLGDLDPKYLHLLEVSKYNDDDNDEAGRVDLVLQRGSEIPDRKVFAESTPTLAGTCEISRLVEQATNRSFFIPCPHCGEHSPLYANETTDRNEGGLWWDRDNDGSTTPARAYKTAEFVCPHCKRGWGDGHRLAQARLGHWVAPGESIDRHGVITGKPVNDGPDESFNLNRMYAPTFTFGDYAKEYVSKVGSEREQDFRNSWQGVPHTPIQSRTTWQKLSKRLCVGDWERGTVPEQCFALTCAIDVQLDHFVCVTFGWCPEKIGYLLDFGKVNDWQGVKGWISATYKHNVGPVRPMLTLIDAKDGNRKDEVIDHCRELNSEHGPFVWPSMGMSPKAFNGQFYSRAKIDKENSIGTAAKGRSIPGLQLVRVGTRLSQEWLDNVLYRRKPTEPNSIVFPEWAAESRSLFEQLVNECYDTKAGTWKHIDTTIPVDFRDAVRYSRVGIETYLSGDWAMNARPLKARNAQAPTPRPAQKANETSTATGTLSGGLKGYADSVRGTRRKGSRFIRRQR